MRLDKNGYITLCAIALCCAALVALNFLALDITHGNYNAIDILFMK